MFVTSWATLHLSTRTLLHGAVWFNTAAIGIKICNLLLKLKLTLRVFFHVIESCLNSIVLQPNLRRKINANSYSLLLVMKRMWIKLWHFWDCTEATSVTFGSECPERTRLDTYALVNSKRNFWQLTGGSAKQTSCPFFPTFRFVFFTNN